MPREVVPGMFVALARHIDDCQCGGALALFEGHYFHITMVGYLLGLTLAFTAAVAFHIAQPALLYIVPAVLMALAILGLSKGELGVLWRGNYKRSVLYDESLELRPKVGELIDV